MISRSPVDAWQGVFQRLENIRGILEVRPRFAIRDPRSPVQRIRGLPAIPVRDLDHVGNPVPVASDPLRCLELRRAQQVALPDELHDCAEVDVISGPLLIGKQFGAIGPIDEATPAARVCGPLEEPAVSRLQGGTAQDAGPQRGSAVEGACRLAEEVSRISDVWSEIEEEALDELQPPFGGCVGHRESMSAGSIELRPISMGMKDYEQRRAPGGARKPLDELPLILELSLSRHASRPQNPQDALEARLLQILEV